MGVGVPEGVDVAVDGDGALDVDRDGMIDGVNDGLSVGTAETEATTAMKASVKGAIIFEY
jgi:hypothetical protein